MEIRHFRYFVAVAEELHFGRAAEMLKISAPTLSEQIRALEASLGAQLFTRRTRGVALTPVGQRFLDEARAVLKQAAHAELIGRQAARGDIGTIAVGFIVSAVCSGVVQGAVREFRARWPGISFALTRLETFPQMKALLAGSLDVGFIRVVDRYPAGLAGMTVQRQTFTMAIPDTHRLAAVERLEPAMLAGEDFVGPPVEGEVGFWPNIAQVMGDTPINIVARAPDAISVLAMVASGIGIGILAESLNRVSLPGLVYREVVGAPTTAEHALVYRRNEGARPVKAFIEFMRRTARDQDAS
jgi:DNA-binding transcriptional LysR family regulator